MGVLKKIYVSLLLGSLTFLASFPNEKVSLSLAEKEPVVLKSVKDEERNGVNIDVGFFAFEGYHDIDEDGNKSGYGYDFLQMMARYTDFTYTYVGYDESWSDMKSRLNDGSIDLVTSASKIDGYTFSTHDIGTKSAILSVKAGNNSFSSSNSYNGMKVGLLSGSSGTNLKFTTFMTDNGYSSYTTTFFESTAELTAALQAGTVDGIVTSSLRKPTDEWILEEIDPAPFYVMFKEGNTALQEQVDTAIDLMDNASPSWRSVLMKKYYSSDSGDNVLFTHEEREYLSSIKASGTVIKAAIDPDYKPYCYFEDGKATGIIPTVFAEIARRLDPDESGAGLNYEVEVCENRKEYKELIYPKEDGSHQIDLVLDGVDDYSLAENNGYKITDPYLSAEISALRLKSFTGEIKTAAIPNYAVPAPALVKMLEGKTITKCETMDECASLVQNGKVDVAYLPNSSARYYMRNDARNKLGYSIVTGYSRLYVVSVSDENSHLLMSSINRAIASLTDEYVAGVVAEEENTEVPMSFTAFVYDYPWAIALLAVFLFIIIFSSAFYYVLAKKRKKEKEQQNELSRFVKYICDSDETVAEINLQDNIVRRYGVDGGDKMVVSEEPLEPLAQYKEGRSDVVFLHEYDCLTKELDLDGLKKLIHDGKPIYFEAKMKKDEVSRWYGFLIQPVEISKEHPLNYILYRRDINDSKKAEEEKKQVLTDALNNAESASEAKGSFLSKMSHEIRTPLNAIIGYLSMIKDAEGDKEKVDHYLANSELASKHLLNVINDVLDMSSIESGHLKIANDPFDIKVLLSTISSIYYAQAKERGLDLPSS